MSSEKYTPTPVSGQPPNEPQHDELFGFRLRGSYLLTEAGILLQRGSNSSYGEPTKCQRGEQPTTMLRNFLRWLQQGRCMGCGMEEWEHQRPFDVHRTVPGKRGGLYTIWNTVLLCKGCHRRDS